MRPSGKPSGKRDAAATVRRCREITEAATVLEPAMQARSDAELRGVTDELKARLARGEDATALAPEAFAAVREAARRVLGQRPGDRQLVGAAAMHLGALVEMKTGEGKTLAITLPAYLGALSGAAVHVVTANDYLAARDAQWMGPVYRALGLECAAALDVGVPEPEARRAVYAADVVYGTAGVLAYDYLRDNGVLNAADRVQRGHGLALVDEADLIMIDEALSSSTIQALGGVGSAARPDRGAPPSYAEMAALAALLAPDTHYRVDSAHAAIPLTDAGIALVEDRLGIDGRYATADPVTLRRLEDALAAKEFYKRDRQYVVVDGAVLRMDQLNGRAAERGTFWEGLNQAIQAKEGLADLPERSRLAAIPIPHYLRRYDRLAGVTGVALEENAYREAYGLETVRVPVERPVRRVDHPSRIFRTEQAMVDAALASVARHRAAGRPVLIGTASIARAEQLSEALDARGLPHEVLNARNNADEARIIAGSGRVGAVTVITGMAGRGVDIRLGGEDPAEQDAVVRNGGLYVLAVDYFQSRRLEAQLRGRAGRRGDPGESDVYVSLEDESFMRMFGPRHRRTLQSSIPLNGESGGRLMEWVLRRELNRRTTVREQQLLLQLRYVNVVGEQGDRVYRLRAGLLDAAEPGAWFLSALDELIERRAAEARNAGRGISALLKELGVFYPVGPAPAALAAAAGNTRRQPPLDTLVKVLRNDAHAAYERRETALGSRVMHELERRVALSVLDREWRARMRTQEESAEHLTLEALGDDARFAAYRAESEREFDAMLVRFRENSVGYLFNLDVQVQGKGRKPPVPAGG